MNMSTRFQLDFGQPADAGRAEADACVFCMPEGTPERADWTGTPVDRTIALAWEEGRFRGKKGDLLATATHGLLPARHLVLAGAGSRPIRSAAVREAAAAMARMCRKEIWREIAVALPAGTNPAEAGEWLQAFTEGILLGQFRIRTYARDAEPAEKLARVRYYVEAPDSAHNGLEERIRRGEIYADATNYARDLTNLPGNLLTPARLAEEAEAMAAACGLGCEVLDEERIRALGMGGLIAVGQGSVHPPRMIVLKYEGYPSGKETIGFAGKGITFDTGGISLKPGEKMEEMISDMGGAAVIMGMLQALARLKARVNVTAVIASAENMPSGAAFKPGDVITTMSGRTVEVLNTDAEGRIVLADAMTYALRLGATRLIDVATLTGAVLTIFADVATAAVTTDDEWLKSLLDAAAAAGEKVWQLPAYPEYWDKLKSDVADLNNSPGKWGSCITAGLFIGTFADGVPWIHLDTGGTAWLWQETALDPKFGSGAMTRTLIEWASRGCR